MSQILDGEVLGTFVATEAIVATANKESTVGRMKGQKSRFLMLRMANVKSAAAQQVWCTYFEGENITAAQLDMLSKHKSATDSQGGDIINMVELRASGDLNNDPILNTLFEVKGGVMKTYKFHKGMCYANDREGNRIVPNRVRDSLQVFCIAETIEMTDAGMTINYFGGRDPETIGNRLENQFYKEPVSVTAEPQEDFAQFNGSVPQPATQPQNTNPQQGAPQQGIPQNPPQQGYQQGGQQGNGVSQQGGNSNIPY